MRARIDLKWITTALAALAALFAWLQYARRPEIAIEVRVSNLTAEPHSGLTYSKQCGPRRAITVGRENLPIGNLIAVNTGDITEEHLTVRVECSPALEARVESRGRPWKDQRGFPWFDGSDLVVRPHGSELPIGRLRDLAVATGWARAPLALVEAEGDFGRSRAVLRLKDGEYLVRPEDPGEWEAHREAWARYEPLVRP